MLIRAKFHPFSSISRQYLIEKQGNIISTSYLKCLRLVISLRPLFVNLLCARKYLVFGVLFQINWQRFPTWKQCTKPISRLSCLKYSKILSSHFTMQFCVFPGASLTDHSIASCCMWVKDVASWTVGINYNILQTWQHSTLEKRFCIWTSIKNWGQA